jgi:hypothetical protein
VRSCAAAARGSGTHREMSLGPWCGLSFPLSFFAFAKRKKKKKEDQNSPRSPCPAKKIGRSSDSSSAACSPRGAHLPAYRRGRRSFRRARTPKLHIERWLLQNRCSPSLWPPQRAQRSAPTPSKSRACARCQPPPAASSCTQHRRKRFHSVPRASIARGCID